MTKRIKEEGSTERRLGSGGKSSPDLDMVKSMRAHARHKFRNRLAKLVGKSLVRMERPLIKATHLQRCQHLLLQQPQECSCQLRHHLLRRKGQDRDPVRNTTNDRHLTFGNVNKTARTWTTMKHPTSLMSLGLVASNGRADQIPAGHRLTAVD